MKIVNNTTGQLVCTFNFKGGGVGCGFIKPGHSLERNFNEPADVIITTDNPYIQYSDVTSQTISVTSNIS